MNYKILVDRVRYFKEDEKVLHSMLKNCGGRLWTIPKRVGRL